VHLLRYRRFLFVSFDADTAAASGYSVYGNEVLLYVTFAVMISVATRAIGALPAFGFTVLPALAALTIASSMGRAFVLAIGIGVISAVVGYYLSFIWELPTGATMVGLAGAIYLAGQVRATVFA
jgi:zinc transport system permease protein